MCVWFKCFSFVILSFRVFVFSLCSSFFHVFFAVIVVIMFFFVKLSFRGCARNVSVSLLNVLLNNSF